MFVKWVVLKQHNEKVKLGQLTVVVSATFLLLQQFLIGSNIVSYNCFKMSLNEMVV